MAATPEPSYLDGWKAIARHLGKDVRTVQRWEESEGLPVHRHPGARNRIFAYSAELDQWWSNREAKGESWRRWLMPVVAGTLALALVATGALFAVKGMRETATPDTVGKETPGYARLLGRVTAEGGGVRWVNVGPRPIQMALTPDGSELWVLDWSDGKIRVVDRQNAHIAHVISVPHRSEAIFITPNGYQVWIGGQNGILQQVDVRTKQTTGRFNVPQGPVRDMELSADGGKLYLAMERGGLWRLWLESGKLETVPGSTVCPVALAATGGGTRLLVSYQCGGPGGRPGHDTIEVLDTATDHPIGRIAGPPIVGGEVAIAPGEEEMWVSSNDACMRLRYDGEGCPDGPSAMFHIFRLPSLTIQESVILPPPTYGHTFTPDGSRVVIAGYPALHVVNARSRLVEEATNLTGWEPNSPGLVALDHTWRRMYLASPHNDRLGVVDLSSSDCQPFKPSLAHLWTADGIPYDVWGSRHGRGMERFGFAPGLIGQAFLLRGPESYVEVSGVPPWTTASHDNWSESIWAKFETGSKEAILHQASLKKGGEVSRFYRDRRGRLAVAVGSSLLKGAAVLEPGVWHHAVATRRGQTVTLYVNGKQDASGELPLSPTDVLDTTLRFGPMKGLIDEIAMFNRTLTAEEVTELYDYTRTCLTAPVR